MSEASNLLRMLEPAVRPGNLPGPVLPPSAAREPIETQSFESLLEEARQVNLTEVADLDESDVSAESRVNKTVTGLLGPLAQIDAVENASLRELIDRTSRFAGA